jgi:hypothetical protein
MLLIQALRTLSMFEELKARIDMGYLAEWFAKTFKMDKNAVIEIIETLNMPGQIPNTGGAVAGLPGQGAQPPIDFQQRVQEMARQRFNGGHMPGDQGLGLGTAQAMSGMREGT